MVIAEARAKVGQMRGVTSHLDYLRNFHEELVERIVGERVMTPEFVGRIDSLDRIAEGADDFASRDMRSDALGGLGEAEVWIDFADGARAVGVAEMMRVPLDALVVVGGEEVGLLDAGRQIDAALEDLVQPGGAGATRADADEVGQPQFAISVGRLVHRLSDDRVSRLRLLPCSEIDAEQFLERLDLGQGALAQELFLLRRQAAKRLAAAVTVIPHPRAL